MRKYQPSRTSPQTQQKKAKSVRHHKKRQANTEAAEGVPSLIPSHITDTTKARVLVEQADITTLRVDAIVNAANTSLLPGGGVCGAIHQAAGPDLAAACAGLGSCPTGSARITQGYNLHARFVIHATGPVYRGGKQGEASLLASCYRAALSLCDTHNLTKVAFPAISTGIFGYPLQPATEIAVGTTLSWLQEHQFPELVIFCCFSEKNAKTYQEILKI